jgi:hypothetical protein
MYCRSMISDPSAYSLLSDQLLESVISIHRSTGLSMHAVQSIVCRNGIAMGQAPEVRNRPQKYNSVCHDEDRTSCIISMFN